MLRQTRKSLCLLAQASQSLWAAALCTFWPWWPGEKMSPTLSSTMQTCRGSYYSRARQQLWGHSWAGKLRRPSYYLWKRETPAAIKPVLTVWACLWVCPERMEADVSFSPVRIHIQAKRPVRQIRQAMKQLDSAVPLWHVMMRTPVRVIKASPIRYTGMFGSWGQSL